MTDRTTIEPMHVTRVEHEGLSHVEPRLDDSWPAEMKIAWKLGCFIEDTGYANIELNFFPTNWSISAPGIAKGGGIGSPRHDMAGIWDALNWIAFGIYAARNETP